MAQDVRPLRPEGRDRPADRAVFAGRVRVNEAGVGDFAAGRAVDAVDFGVREGFEGLCGRGAGVLAGVRKGGVP